MVSSAAFQTVPSNDEFDAEVQRLSDALAVAQRQATALQCPGPTEECSDPPPILPPFREPGPVF